MTVFSSLALVFATAAIALGLAAVVAGVEPVRVVGSDALVDLTGTGPEPDTRWRTTETTSLVSYPKLSMTPFVPVDPVVHPRSCPNGACASPLYPQNGVTLWDRIRSATTRSNRAFVLGTGIQVHAAATAATPGPVRTRKDCCPNEDR